MINEFFFVSVISIPLMELRLPIKIPEGANSPKVWECDFFDANHIWIIKVDDSRSLGPNGPPQWSGQNLGQIWHWDRTLWATTPPPGLLFHPKHNRDTSFMMRNRLVCWNPESVKVDFPPFWHPFCWFFLREMDQNGYLTNHWSVSLHFFCNDILLL